MRFLVCKQLCVVPEMESIFTRIYDNKTWVSDSVPDCPLSGPGSTSAATAPLRTWLQSFLASMQCKHLVDIGCGDHRALSELPLADDQHYTGIDCVAKLVQGNMEKYTPQAHPVDKNLPDAESTFPYHNPHSIFEQDTVVIKTNQKTFIHADVTVPDYQFPSGDVAIFKDVLSHWPNHLIVAILWKLWRERTYKHIILVHCAKQDSHWQDCAIGGFRPLDGSINPLSIFKPSRLFMYATKHVYIITPGAVDITVTHPPIRCLPDQTRTYPSVAIAILVKDKAAVLPYYLSNIEQFEYPKNRLHLYVRTNNNTDSSANILAAWLERVGSQYVSVHYDDSDLEVNLERFADHEWTGERFKALGAIRRESMNWAVSQNCDFYWVQDVDNFVLPNCLAEMVATDVNIVAPLVRIGENFNRGYANYHGAIDPNGYFADDPMYFTFFHRKYRGLSEQPVVHCTYLVKTSAIPRLTYDDDSGRYEYVIFSHSARKAGIPQLLDTHHYWGWLTFLGASDHFHPDTYDCLLHTL